MSLEVDVEHARGSFRLQARFTAAPGLMALFGRSGSGKTTLVDIVGGLVKPDRGRVAVDGQVLVDTERGVFVPKHRRRIGYVFQDSRLFPHLSVQRNLLYGRWFNRPVNHAMGGGAAADLASVVELLGIGPLLERQPASLSGGEKQRVAIGRALLAHPQLLLMDEPLASLDEARRAEILPYIERLRDEAGVPILYVSHSVAEVARLATTVVILTEGKVTAVGPVGDILSQADSGDAGSVLEAVVDRHDESFQLTVLATPAGELQVPRRHRARLHPWSRRHALAQAAGRDQCPQCAGRPYRRHRARRRAGRGQAGLQRRAAGRAADRQIGGAPLVAARQAGLCRDQERLVRTQLGAAMPRLSIRIDFDDEGRLGPGKVALLEEIARAGSISAAGRAMNMSYKRAWELVADINDSFAEPLVSAQTGGRSGGGASLTPRGEELVRHYRAIERKALSATASHLRALQAISRNRRKK
jgi:molybdate transport system ATP-binding protein